MRGKKYSPQSIQFFKLTQDIVIEFGLNLKIKLDFFAPVPSTKCGGTTPFILLSFA